jgi:hypothetical protein
MKLVLLAVGLALAALAQYQPAEQHRAGLAEVKSIAANCLPLARERTQRRVPPRHIKVGKVTYTVELVKEVPALAEFASFSSKTCDKTARKLGVCDAQDHIYLEAGQPLKEEQAALLHELQHAIFGTENSDRGTTYHQVIYRLSPKLLEVLQENPDLYPYLTASESR